MRFDVFLVRMWLLLARGNNLSVLCEFEPLLGTGVSFEFRHVVDYSFPCSFLGLGMALGERNMIILRPSSFGVYPQCIYLHATAKS